MRPVRILLVLCALFAPLGALAVGCDKDEDTPATTTPPPPPPPPPPPVELKPPEEPDAGLAVEDAGDDADAGKKKPTGSFDPTGIRACCRALRQNAASAPADQQGLLLSAAAACDAAASQGSGALAIVRGMLRGAALPPACR